MATGSYHVESDYSKNVLCKCLLNSDAGKRIKLDFSTQANVDYVWIFHGGKALQENLVAKFSGSSLPPVFVTGSSQVLLWFITDAGVTDSGWKLNYSATDGNTGIRERQNYI